MALSAVNIPIPALSTVNVHAVSLTGNLTVADIIEVSAALGDGVPFVGPVGFVGGGGVNTLYGSTLQFGPNNNDTTVRVELAVGIAHLNLRLQSTDEAFVGQDGAGRGRWGRVHSVIVFVSSSVLVRNANVAGPIDSIFTITVTRPV
ncbi:hypothetical protein DXG01_003331 [Tephrocybe rancida]|nr:hypothetical protein DXG01_003331 [Tephrocybe rancida]